MSRHIDGNELRNKVLYFADAMNLEGNHEQTKAYNHCLCMIDDMPTADVVEVVRCKDCTWWKSIFSWNGKEHKVCVKDSSEPPREQNDFCSYAERREDVD